MRKHLGMLAGAGLGLAVGLGLPIVAYGVHRNFAAGWDVSRFFLGSLFLFSLCLFWSGLFFVFLGLFLCCGLYFFRFLFLIHATPFQSYFLI